MLFSHVKISCFCAKDHLVFDGCLHNKKKAIKVRCCVRPFDYFCFLRVHCYWNPLRKPVSTLCSQCLECLGCMLRQFGFRMLSRLLSFYVNHLSKNKKRSSSQIIPSDWKFLHTLYVVLVSYHVFMGSHCIVVRWPQSEITQRLDLKNRMMSNNAG